MMVLNGDQRHTFRERGYLLVSGLVESDAVTRFKRRSGSAHHRRTAPALGGPVRSGGTVLSVGAGTGPDIELSFDQTRLPPPMS